MKLRYFFDVGSGICIWAGDEESRAKFGYPVSLEMLPLHEQTLQRGVDQIRRYDSSIDWNNPGGKSIWTAEEKAIFLQDAADFYHEVNNQLGTGYEVINEVRT